MPVTVAETWSGNAEMYRGLTKRELFAMAAMQGFCSNSSPQVNEWDAPKTASSAVSFADALLTELEKVRP